MAVSTGVRNGPLARMISSSTSWYVVGTVPADFTWLLKAVHFTNFGTAPAEVQLRIIAPNDQAVAAWLMTAELGVNEFVTWSGWTTLTQTDQLAAYLPAGVHCWASGAELPGVVPTQAARVIRTPIAEPR